MSMLAHRWRTRGLAAFMAVVLGVFLVWPLLLVVRGAFVDIDGTWTLAYLLDVFRDPLLLSGLVNSVIVAAVTTALSLFLALPLSILGARYRFPAKGALTGMVLVPLILPPFVGAIGLQALLGRFGALNSAMVEFGLRRPDEPGIAFLAAGFVGVVIMEALHLFPIAYLNLSAALANIDPSLEEAAVNLGAGPWRRLRKITLPLMMPGVFAGATIVFIWSFTELGTPLMFGFRGLTAVQIFEGLAELQTSPRPYALVVVMLAAAVGLYAMSRLVLGRRGYASSGKAAIAADLRPLEGWRGWAAAGFFAGVTWLAVLPHLGVVLASFSADGAWYRSVLPRAWTLDHFESALSHPLAVGAIRNSLMLSLAAMVVCVMVGATVAHLNVRGRVRGAWLLDTLAMLPLAVPGLVMAFGYVAMTLQWPFAEGDLLGGLFSVIGQDPNPLVLLVIAYAVRRLPYVVRAVSAGLEQTSITLEEAAVNLGAKPPMVLRRIVLPLIAANVIAGAVLAFSFAMLEVSDSLVLAQRQAHFPITKAIFEFYSRLGDGPYIASAMGVWGMALLSLTLIAAAMLLGRRMGALFRL